MRMWMVDPELMCDRHLLGEHVELHMLVGCIKRGKSLKGYIENGLVELESIFRRHAELVIEMNDRGFKHDSHISMGDALAVYRRAKYERSYVDASASLRELHRRCAACAER